MPWQAVPPLLIIGGAFTATGLLLNGFDYVTIGRVSEIVENKFDDTDTWATISTLNVLTFVVNNGYSSSIIWINTESTGLLCKPFVG